MTPVASVAGPRGAARAARLIAAAALLAAAAACEPEALRFNGIALDPPEPAPALRLADAGGGTFDLAAERGNVVLIFFGFTRCPDVCPTTLAEWARIRATLGDDARDVRFVFVSVDTLADTPAAARDYARGFDSTFVGLVADAGLLARLTEEFKVAAYEVPDEHAGHPMLAHGTQSFVVDREGRLRVLHPAGSRAADVQADVERLLD